MQVTCGIDMSKRQSLAVVIDGPGNELVHLKFRHDRGGLADLQRALAVTRVPRRAISIAVEDASPPLVSQLRRAGYDVRLVHPLTAARFRDGQSPGRGKSDRGDAAMLANLLRLEGGRQRSLPALSELAEGIRVLAREHEELSALKRRRSMQLRTILECYYPAAVDALPSLYRRSARTSLRVAPTPTRARHVKEAELASAMAAWGLRGAATRADRILAGLRRDDLVVAPLAEAAYGEAMLASLDTLEAAIASADTLCASLLALFSQHPQFFVYASFPGLGGVLGARIFAEIGDDQERFASPGNLRAFAGLSPVTRASGGTVNVRRRTACNRRLQHDATLWVLPLITACPSARERYDRRRSGGERHPAAARNVASYYFGVLFHCLRMSRRFDPGHSTS